MDSVAWFPAREQIVRPEARGFLWGKRINERKMYRAGVQTLAPIVLTDREGPHHVGQMLDVPCLYDPIRAGLSGPAQERRFYDIANSLYDQRMEWLGGAAEQLFTPSQQQQLIRAGFRFAHGRSVRRALLRPAAHEALKAAQLRLHEAQAVICGADEPEGQYWAWYLAKYMNHMVLTGRSRRRIQFLADRLLHETGLAAYVSPEGSGFLQDAQLAVMASDAQENMPHLSRGALAVMEQPGINPALLPHKVTAVCGGLPKWPEEIDTGLPLSVSQRPAMAEALTWTMGREMGCSPERVGMARAMERVGFPLEFVLLGNQAVPIGQLARAVRGG